VTRIQTEEVFAFRDCGVGRSESARTYGQSHEKVWARSARPYTCIFLRLVILSVETAPGWRR